MNNSAKILIAIGAGAAIGAMFGILFAPDKVSETRSKIKSRKEKFGDDLNDLFRLGKGKCNELKQDIEQTVKEKVKEFA